MKISGSLLNNLIEHVPVEFGEKYIVVKEDRFFNLELARIYLWEGTKIEREGKML
jgi:hypothetical protein